MKAHRILQRLALASLLIVAVLNLYGQVVSNIRSPFIHLLPIVAGFALWALLLRKIYERPKQWGLGVGIFLLLMSALQIYLWHLAMSRPDHIGLGAYANVRNFIWYQTPIVVGGILCVLLRWYYPVLP